MAAKAVNRCVIICGSPDASAGFIKECVRSDDFVIAADSGLNYAETAQIKPDLLVGDFDSYTGILPKDVKTVCLPTHKDDTDSMHCAAVAEELGYKDICLLAATGGRLDHTLSNLSVLKYLTERGISCMSVSESETVYCFGEGEYSLNGNMGKTFSVIPAFCDRVVVTYSGDVEYPANSLELSGSLTVGVSNIFRSNENSIVVENGFAFVLINNFVKACD